LAGSRQSYCKNKEAYFFGPPCKSIFNRYREIGFEKTLIYCGGKGWSKVVHFLSWFARQSSPELNHPGRCNFSKSRENVWH